MFKYQAAGAAGDAPQHSRYISPAEPLSHSSGFLSWRCNHISTPDLRDPPIDGASFHGTKAFTYQQKLLSLYAGFLFFSICLACFRSPQPR
jgi:hypothetical protein